METVKRLFISLIVLLGCTAGAWSQGVLPGLFSVNASGDKVQFSQGNLQYFCSTTAPEWRFAEHQYDYVAFDISAYTENSGKWIDLFAHGTSGYNNAQNYYQPYVVGASPGTYYQGNLTGNADWGYNAISNGGNTENSGWRTPTRDEWVYLLSGRSNADSKYGQGSINGVNGLILLPDDWSLPDGLNFTPRTSAWTNSYTTEQWALMESAGAVFLPASGSCNSAGIPPESTQNLNGFYRTSTAAYYLYFSSNNLQNCSASYYQYGDAVRLVKDVKLEMDDEGYYLIGSVTDWKRFAAIINSGTNPAANAKMIADVDLGDDQTMVGTYHQKYQGTFDGQGHTLIFNYNTAGMSPEPEQRAFSLDFLGAAPFRDIEGATILNLHTAGSVTAQNIGAAGLVGWTYGTNTIEKCWSDVDIVSSNNTADTFAGFVAFQYGTQLNITDCVYTGKIQSTSKISHAGFVAFQRYGKTSLNNCLLLLDKGSDVNTTPYQNLMYYTFVRNHSEHYVTNTINNCYYLTPFGVAQGTQTTDGDISDGTTAAALQADRSEEIWVQDPVLGIPMLKLFAKDLTYTVPSSGIGTFSAKGQVLLPEGLKAYYCKTYHKKNSTISVVGISGNIVPAATGVLLVGNKGETFTLTGACGQAPTITDNELVPVTESKHIAATDGDYTNFMMKGGKFIKIADDNASMPANRAYLPLLTAAISGSNAKEIMLYWNDEEATGIERMRNVENEIMRNESIYNLNGQKLSAPQKGINIINGRKVIVK